MTELELSKALPEDCTALFWIVYMFLPFLYRIAFKSLRIFFLPSLLMATSPTLLPVWLKLSIGFKAEKGSGEFSTA